MLKLQSLERFRVRNEQGAQICLTRGTHEIIHIYCEQIVVQARIGLSKKGTTWNLFSDENDNDSRRFSADDGPNNRAEEVTVYLFFNT